MYSFDIRPSFDRKLKKIAKKNKQIYIRIEKKMAEVLKNPQHYKNLRKPLQHLKAVHIGHFVLIFSVNENTKTVIFEDFDHHDYAYY